MLLRIIFFWTLLLLSCGYALLRGGKYERSAAVVFLSATLVSVAWHHLFPSGYRHIILTEVLVDTAVLMSVTAIALMSDRFWPLWVAGLQLVDSTAHFLRAIYTNLPPWAYAIAERFWSYPILVILLIGAWRQNRRTQAAREAPSA